jgi:DNA-binding IclR family transcriptional regulator
VEGDEVPVRSIARALDLIVALEAGPQTLGALALTSRLSKGTAHRLLATLATAGLVTQDPATATYTLGPGCFGILDAVVHGAGGLDILAGHILADLSMATRETVALSVRSGTQRLTVAQVASPQPVRYTAHLGTENPIHAGAMGKVLLAFAEPADREELLGQIMYVPVTPATITTRGGLEKELDEVRRRGVAISHGERAVGVAAISAPVFDADGRVLAALSILGPEERMSDRVLRSFEAPLLDAAGRITERIASLGGTAISWSGDDDLD